MSKLKNIDLWEVIMPIKLFTNLSKFGEGFFIFGIILFVHGVHDNVNQWLTYFYACVFFFGFISVLQRDIEESENRIKDHFDRMIKIQEEYIDGILEIDRDAIKDLRKENLKREIEDIVGVKID